MQITVICLLTHLLFNTFADAFIQSINQSINIRFITAKTTADAAATEVFKTRMRSLLSRTKVGMFS